MFFGNELVSKKEPIRVLWLAATLGKRSKKLSKKKILEANIPSLTSEIIEKGSKMIVSSSINGQSSNNMEGYADYSSYSLRLSSTLLLGVVVIFNKKAQYLLSEGNQMVHKARQISVRLDQTTDSTLLDKKEARFEAITLKPFKDFELITGDSALVGEEMMARWYRLVGANTNGELENEDLSNFESSSAALEAELNGGVKALENEQPGVEISIIKPVRESDIFMAGVDIFEAGIDPMPEQQEEDLNNGEFNELGGLEISIIEPVPMMTVTDDLDTTFKNSKKRKRSSNGKLVIDEQTQISSDDMRAMIQDYSALITKRGFVKNVNPFSKTDNWYSADIFSKGKLDKTTMDKLFYTIPCGYDPTNEEFNSDFENIYTKSLKKLKSNETVNVAVETANNQLADEDVHHLNNFLDGELGGLDGEIEQPREDHFDIPERLDEDELTSILLNPGEISALLSTTIFQKQTSPQKRPSLIPEETDELLRVFEDAPNNNTAISTHTHGSTMVPKSWGMLDYMKKKVEEESLNVNKGQKVYLSFDKLIRDGNNTKRLRQKASQGFYQLLVLASNNHIEIKSLDKIYVKQ